MKLGSASLALAILSRALAFGSRAAFLLGRIPKAAKPIDLPFASHHSNR
jgi:hypothetical protein